ncbi:LamG domain-containing protein [Nocardioides sp. NPDC047086]|uniref:LamG domain-containing protein n=1 Tax=Nocardioides sp. NPDC047086 TaxID=3154810 RepID=UPI0033F11519
MAEASGESVVASEYTTERDLVTAVPGEGLVVESTVDPVRIQRGEDWVDVDPSLASAGDGRLVPAATIADMTISGNGEGALVEIAAPGGESLALSWPAEYGDLPTPTVEGDLAVYKSVWPDIDLVVRAGVESFSTYLVVHTAEAAARPEVADFAFDIEVDGAELRTDDQGRVEAVNASGDVVLATDLPRAWDAGESGGAAVQDLVTEPVGARTADMEMAVDPADGAMSRMFGEGTGDRLRLQTPADFLTASDLRFPLVLDPTVTVADQDDRWAMVWDNGDDWYGAPDDMRGRVGYDGWSSAKKISRMYYQFPIDQFDGTDLKIQSATFKHKQVHSPEHTCDTSGSPAVEVYRTGGYGAGISWGNQPERMALQDSSTLRSGHIDYGCDARYQEWDVVTGLRSAKFDNWPRYTLMVKSASAVKDGWRLYGMPLSGYPKLVVTYNRAPSAPTGMSTSPATTCSGGTYLRDTTPVLSAKFSDPDGHNVSAKFDVGINGSLLWSSGYDGAKASGQFHEVTVPSGTLSDGKTYIWRARGRDISTADNREGDWSTMCSFTIDTTRPALPTVTSSGYPEDQIAGGIGTGGSFTFKSSSDTKSFRYSFNGATPKTENASSIGGTLTKTFTPSREGSQRLTVEAIDRAGNVSDAKTYRFSVDFATAAAQWRMDDTSADPEADPNVVPDAVTGGEHPLTVPTSIARGDGPFRAFFPNDFPDDQALEFDGTDNAAMSPNAVLNTSQPFTITTYVRVDAVEDATRVAVSQDGQLYGGVQLGQLGSQYCPESMTTCFGFWMRPSDSGTDTRVTSARPVNPGEWVHLSAVWDAPNKQMTLYTCAVGTPPDEFPIDSGVPAATSTSFEPTGWSPGGPVRVGSNLWNGVEQNRWKGGIDDVRLYTAVRPESAISSICAGDVTA